MNELVLRLLMQLFALIIDVKKDESKNIAINVFSTYLENVFSRNLREKYIQEFEAFVSDAVLLSKMDDTNSNKLQQIRDLCRGFVEEIDQDRKVWLMLQLLEFIDDSHLAQDSDLEYIRVISDIFQIPNQEFELSRSFIISDQFKIPYSSNLLIINSKYSESNSSVKHIYNEKLRGELLVLHLESTNTFLVKYLGENNLLLNGHVLKTNRAYIMSYGSVIRSHRISPIYYSEIASKFIQTKNYTRINYVANEIEYKFPGSNNGIYPVNLRFNSGELIGIMGGSGTGKSTLLNVLNGNLKLSSGNIYVNGHSLEKKKHKINRIIGYVPQDDLLIEELTVYQNLMYNAKLCFKDMSSEQIEELIDLCLENFDLVEARDLVIGDPLNKVISGGQRKRVNLALEMMREPSILFADEPTSGLSSMDSEKVMILLKRLTIKGRLVICNIHQPSSDIYKLFDKIIIMDQGGRVIYFGNPSDAVVYFKTHSHYLNPEESECLHCGNIRSENILRIVEARMMDELGKQVRKRKRTPQEWYDLFRKENSSISKSKMQKNKIPKNDFSIPGKLRQLQIYFSRDVFSKFRNRQYLFISLLEAPLLAVILGYFTKFITEDQTGKLKYVFSENENIPSFIFMSVIVALFLGLVVSAEEIIHDRRIIKRENFLNLSRFSYINAKLIVLFILSAIQTVMFVVLATSILEIKSLFWEYFLMLFSVSFCANLIGLNLSSSIKTVVAVYVAIPFVLVPQILLSGVVVNFNKLHPSISSQEFVPTIGDVMISRWAYEGLMVKQYCGNEFQKSFTDIEREISNQAYLTNYYFPKLIDIVKDKSIKKSKLRQDIIRNELDYINQEFMINNHNVNKLERRGLVQFLKSLEYNSRFELTDNMRKRDSIFMDMETKLGSENLLLSFRDRYFNKALSYILKEENNLEKIIVYDNKLIRKKDPIYNIPRNKYGRSHFYASLKRLGNNLIDTYWFNLIVIWLFTIIFYLTLYFDFFRKIGRYIEIVYISVLSDRSKRVLRKRQS
ncbi:MAG: ATP-binding cassette domain-containing protein [Marinifilaceae bacterium]|jgi:ABC-type multidrug transport system ATPase subunit|nr:ATP-binding cassette domain-containing protein [Marinifilaceae bacterium]